MILIAERDGASCLEMRTHEPINHGTNSICIRCGMLLGPSDEPELGTLLDY